MNTTPKKITKRIRKFVATLGNVGEPEYITFTPTSDKYLAEHCLSNCEAESHFSGLPIVYGWILWQDRVARYIEAEFHAVIRRGGRFIDVTPRTDGENRVLFVADNVRIATRSSEREWITSGVWGQILNSDKRIGIW